MWFNPIMKWILRSPMHGLISKSVMLVTFAGRKSGKVYTVPVNYVRDGDQYLTVSYRQRNWWRNLRGGVPVTLHIEGQDLKAVAEVEEETTPVAENLTALFRSAPQVARYLAVKLAPKEPLARLQLAKADERAGDWTGAVEQYQALEELKPGEPEYVYGLGNAYLRLSEWCLRELDTLDAGSARLHQAQGHNYRVQGRPDLALTAFERAAKADPALPEIHLAMAQIHMEQKRWAEARQEIERELQIVPESAGARALLDRLSVFEAGGP